MLLVHKDTELVEVVVTSFRAEGRYHQHIESIRYAGGNGAKGLVYTEWK